MNKRIIGILSFILIVLIIALLGVSIKYAFRDNAIYDKEQIQNEEDKEETVEEVIKTEEKTNFTYDENEIYQAVTQKDFNRLKEIADDEIPNPDIAFIVGEMYLLGEGTYQDEYNAAYYIDMAARGGVENSFWTYSRMLFLGEGDLKQDYEEALKYAYVIKDKVDEAKDMLAVMYEYGLGTDFNYEYANIYYQHLSDKKLPKVDTSSIAINNVKYKDKKIKKEIDKLTKELSDKLNYEKYTLEIENIKKMNRDLVNSVVIFGKDNWPFWKHPNDGDSYRDYIGNNAYTENEMAIIADNLLKEKAMIEGNGARFVLMVIPNKETVYYEYMPNYIKREDSITRKDKLVDYLSKNTDIEIVYLRDEFSRIKNDTQLYYKTDTHTNMLGSFVCISKLIEQLYGRNLELDVANFQIHMRDFCGDIGNTIDRADKYSVDTVYFLSDQGINEEDKVTDSATIIGDSFSEFINMEMQHYFLGGVNHIMIRDYDYNYYQALDSRKDSYNSDIVIWEVTERFADRLKK